MIITENIKKKKEKLSSFCSNYLGKMLDDPATADPYYFWGKKFFRRFRVPFSFFKEILVPMCEEGIFRMFVCQELQQAVL